MNNVTQIETNITGLLEKKENVRVQGFVNRNTYEKLLDNYKQLHEQFDKLTVENNKRTEL